MKKEINELVKIIEDNKTEESLYSYRNAPELETIISILNKGYERDKDTLIFVYECYDYLANVYTVMGRFALSAKFRLKAIKNAQELHSNYSYIPKNIQEELYKLLRDRNFYIDDNCEDVKPIVEGLFPSEVVEQLFSERMKRRRSLNNDPAEMSEEYLKVIDEVEEKIEKNRKMHGMGSCFEVWELKAQYLEEYGIHWSSPSILNPRVMFD